MMLDSGSTKLDHEGTRLRARANYGPVVLGQSISLFGDYLSFFALPWFVVELTGRERAALAVLRVGAIAVLVFALHRPVLRLSTVVPQQNFLGVLVDGAWAGGEDFDPARGRLVPIVKRLFPDLELTP